MKDRDKIANMLQNQIMELVKSLNDIGYNFKLTHNGVASEIRQKPIYKDEEKLASQLDAIYKIDKINDALEEKLAFEKSSCKDDYIYKLDNPEKKETEK